MVEGRHIRKLLGLRYHCKRTETGEAYILMSMKYNTYKIDVSCEKHAGKTPKIYENPGAPGTTLQKNEGKPITLKEYRSLVGQNMFTALKSPHNVHLQMYN